MRIDRGRHHSLSGACLEGELFVHLAHRRRLDRHWGLAPSAGNQTAFPVRRASVAKVHAFEPLRVDLTSALVSQVLAEFSRYAATDTRGIESHIWTVYAVSKYLWIS